MPRSITDNYFDNFELDAPCLLLRKHGCKRQDRPATIFEYEGIHLAPGCLCNLSVATYISIDDYFQHYDHHHALAHIILLHTTILLLIIVLPIPV